MPYPYPSGRHTVLTGKSQRFSLYGQPQPYCSTYFRQLGSKHIMPSVSLRDLARFISTWQDWKCPANPRRQAFGSGSPLTSRITNHGHWASSGPFSHPPQPRVRCRCCGPASRWLPHSSAPTLRPETALSVSWRCPISVFGSRSLFKKYSSFIP